MTVLTMKDLSPACSSVAQLPLPHQVWSQLLREVSWGTFLLWECSETQGVLQNGDVWCRWPQYMGSIWAMNYFRELYCFFITAIWSFKNRTFHDSANLTAYNTSPFSELFYKWHFQLSTREMLLSIQQQSCNILWSTDWRPSCKLCLSLAYCWFTGQLN